MSIRKLDRVTLSVTLRYSDEDGSSEIVRAIQELSMLQVSWATM